MQLRVRLSNAVSRIYQNEIVLRVLDSFACNIIRYESSSQNSYSSTMWFDCLQTCLLHHLLSRFLVLQFATIIEQTAGLLSSSAEDNLRQLDDAKRSVPEEGSALLIIKGNYNSSTTRVVHVKIDLTSCRTPQIPIHMLT